MTENAKLIHTYMSYQDSPTRSADGTIPSSFTPNTLAFSAAAMQSSNLSLQLSLYVSPLVLGIPHSVHLSTSASRHGRRSKLHGGR